jgi:uncharacterized protein YjiS (DUF1127 family)
MVMATCEHRETAPGVWARLVDRVGATLRRARSRRETRAAIRQLLRMDDHVLRDIGLTRADAVLVLRDPDALPDRRRLRRC